MTRNILIAGFGGQGILFAGKFLAYAGMTEGKNVSWLPSYGPEMRGGTANCGIIISDTPVGSPLVHKPDLLIALNLPSLDTFESECVPGADIFVDSSLIPRQVGREDVTTYYIPATTLAEENELSGLANMVILGLVIEKTGIIARETIETAMQRVIPPKKARLCGLNIAAIELGRSFINVSC